MDASSLAQKYLVSIRRRNARSARVVRWDSTDQEPPSVIPILEDITEKQVDASLNE